MKAQIIFVHNVFDIKNPGTYMAPFIRSALSLDNYNTGDEPVYHNHCAIKIKDDVIEAGWNKERKRGEVILLSFEEWKIGRLEKDFFAIDVELVKDPYSEIGKPYGLKDVIIHQPIRLVCRKKVWTGSEDTDSHYCSKLASYCLGYDNFFEIDTEDLYNKLKTA